MLAFTNTDRKIWAAAPCQIETHSGTGRKILYTFNNGQEFLIPHLVLRRGGQITSADERSLTVNISGLQVPPQGLTVDLVVQTMHTDPDVPGNQSQKITVWRGEQHIMPSEVQRQNVGTAVFNILFDGPCNYGWSV